MILMEKGSGGRGRGLRGRGRSFGREGGRRSAAGSEWWQNLDGDDVISLEPLATLSYEVLVLIFKCKVLGTKKSNMFIYIL